MPKVSVIIPVYNVEEYLRECLDSVINQTLADIEIICINDGSTDGSLNILKEYAQKDERIKLIDRENKGVAKSRNEGIRKATGQFVCFMDPDDYYPEADVLESLYANAVANNVMICGGEFACFTNKNRTLVQDFGDTFDGYLFPQNKLLDYIEYQFDYGYTRFMYNREFLINNDILFPNYKRFQDPPFFVKAMICAGKFYAINKITYAYRCGYKQVNWTKEKVHDLLHGILDDAKYAHKHKLEKLAKYSEIRLEQHYPAITGYITDLNSILILNKISKYNSGINDFCIEHQLSIKDYVQSKIIRRIFSVRNDDRKTHKIITILGMKIKIRKRGR